MCKAVYFLLLSIGLLLTLSCRKDKLSVVPPLTPPVTPATLAELRIFNAAPWPFYNCIIDPTGTLSDNPTNNAFNYGQVDVNAKTEYKLFSTLFRYSWVRLTMNSKVYYLKPYDYSGETPLASGRYTFKLSYTATTDQLKLELIKD